LTDVIVGVRSAEGLAKLPEIGRGASLETTIDPRWRIDKTKPLVRGTEIPIGTVNENIENIEVVYPDTVDR
jgi:hypothetical protein